MHKTDVIDQHIHGKRTSWVCQVGFEISIARV